MKAYLKQVPEKPQPRLSFVEAVKAQGDSWMFAFEHIPDAVRRGSYCVTFDWRERLHMRAMELGQEPRVEYDE